MSKVKRKVTLGGEAMFPNEWLSAVDLKGKDVTLTVHSIKVEEMPHGDEVRPVLRFAELEQRPKDKRKRLGLNKTNATAIASLYGREAMDWIGKRVTLYPTTCSAFGEVVDCIRVRPTKPHEKDAPVETQPPMPEEAPDETEAAE